MCVCLIYFISGTHESGFNYWVHKTHILWVTYSCDGGQDESTFDLKGMNGIGMSMIFAVDHYTYLYVILLTYTIA